MSRVAVGRRLSQVRTQAYWANLSLGERSHGIQFRGRAPTIPIIHRSALVPRPFPTQLGDNAVPSAEDQIVG